MNLMEQTSGRLIVQKTFSKNDSGAMHQFEKELSFSKIVHSEFVGQLIDWTEDSGHFTLNYPFLGEQNFKQYIDQQPSTQETFKAVISIIQKLLKAVNTLHDFDVIHYDIKPSNIVLNDKLDLFIIDSSNWQQRGKPILYADHLHSFTRVYGSPEHYSRGIPSPQTDYFQVAMTLIYALVEEAQFARFSDSDCSLSELIQQVWAPNSTCRDRLRSMLAKSTASSPEDRWTDINEFSNELSRLISD